MSKLDVADHFGYEIQSAQVDGGKCEVVYSLSGK